MYCYKVVRNLRSKVFDTSRLIDLPYQLSAKRYFQSFSKIDKHLTYCLKVRNRWLSRTGNAHTSYSSNLSKFAAASVSSSTQTARYLSTKSFDAWKCHWHGSQRKCENTKRFASSAPQQRSFLNITWYGALVFFIFMGGAYYFYLKLEEEAELRKSTDRITALSESGLGQLNWTLTDQFSKHRQYSEFRGQWLMVYFGFCHCPDICPEELEKLVDVVKAIDSNKNVPNIQPIFITLDPDRDTVTYMHKYCQDFSDKLIGFTGTKEEIAEVAKAYRVYYSLGEKDEEGDYIVDHTICMYLINPDGQMVDVYERRTKIDGIVQGSIAHMSEYEKIKYRLSNL